MKESATPAGAILTATSAQTLILASASPRRREILASLGVQFRVQSSVASEDYTGNPAPEDLVQLLACRKAEAVARLPESAGSIVIGADTVVALGNEILGKPGTPERARAMLAALSGREHRVCTGISLWQIPQGGEPRHSEAVSVTTIRFRTLTPLEIDAYVATGEPLDKAGAYGIQERAAPFVTALNGDFYGVVGLPVALLDEQMFGFCGKRLLQFCDFCSESEKGGKHD